MDPHDESAYYNIAIIFLKQGRYAEAKDYINKAISHFGKETKWGRAAQSLFDIIMKMENSLKKERMKIFDESVPKKDKINPDYSE